MLGMLIYYSYGVLFFEKIGNCFLNNNYLFIICRNGINFYLSEFIVLLLFIDLKLFLL